MKSGTEAKKSVDPVEARYLNREISWLRFNERVLAEAECADNPLLERLKFLSIFESNLDEFYMVRVSGLIEQYESGVSETSPDGLTATEQLRLIAAHAHPLRQRAAAVLHGDVLPKLGEFGIGIREWDSLSARIKATMGHYYQKEVFPLCTPLILDPAQSVPFISNRSLNLCVELLGEDGEVRLARVKIPTVICRWIRLGKRKAEYLSLESLIAAHIHTLFPGVEVRGVYTFRVIRDADVEIREIEAADLITSIEETLRLRRFGDPVLLQVQVAMPGHVRNRLMQLLELDPQDVFVIDGQLGMEDLQEIAKIDKPELRYPVHIPFLPESLSNFRNIFDQVRHRNVMVHHPFDSFRIVEEFIGSVKNDPHVIGIKQTLYRVGKESPIVEDLLDAAEEGKQVAAMVELKARFDESNNLEWAKALEKAGAHVTFGFMETKTHCKLCLIVRKEPGGLVQYAHIGTGNYNPVTARLYTDLGLLTCDEDVCQDISELFNYLTGYSKQNKYRKLLVAPLNLRDGIISRIRREAKIARRTGSGLIILKLNALVDPEIIDELYEASSAGVKIELIIRGICCLRPDIPGLSENIRVRSIIGRFLEHSRVYYFGNDGEPDVLIGSADAMRRNFDRRIEVLVPVEDAEHVNAIRTRILQPYLKDTAKAWILFPDGQYNEPRRNAGAFHVQGWLMANPITKDCQA